MSYIVVYQRADGSSGLEECETLDLAVVAAERLRNVDSVESPRILKTEEVKFDFRPYYRVEVSSEEEIERPTPLSAPLPAATLASTSISAEQEAAPEPPAPVADVPSKVVPPVAPVSETVAAPAADTSTETSAETEPAAAIDPWATADGSPIDYSLQSAVAEADDVPAVETPAPAESLDTEQELASSARGLFSTSTLPDPPNDVPDAAEVADEIGEPAPPRRGLFGR